MAAVIASLTRKTLNTSYWSDSTTVLAWIQRDLQWGTFVRNRINEIRSFSENDTWKYVPGESNPADLPSRGCSPSQLVASNWWLGPKWLTKSSHEWPDIKREVNEEEVSAEIKKSSMTHMINVDELNFKASEFFSSYSKIVRFLAWMNRFLNNCRNKIRDEEKQRSFRKGANTPTQRDRVICANQSRERTLTVAEIKEAETKLIKCVQERMFIYGNKNKLSSFKTKLNEKGLYVLKTRITSRDDDSNFLCPILLDSNHDVVYLLVRETHEKLGHVGSQIIMNNLRERFWIISLRKIAKIVISKCVICQKQKAKNLQCETPPLPLNRVRDVHIFEVVGVDFAGPLFLRGGGKSWVCIFTCAIYRAVHFELASSLSTDAFLECLRRFIARRGRPRNIYSDNGTNFAGAFNAFKALNWEKIEKYSSASQIQWYFNPPSALWWGGWWERLIGVLKSILRKVLGKACLSYESLATVLCDAEAIINSRPLTYVSEDPEDLKPLSPSNFLCEIQEFGTPDCDMMCQSKLNRKLKYRQSVLKALRVRFRSEYLGSLISKNKKREKRDIKIGCVGCVVLIGDDNRKRIDWPLARITSVIKGQDGVARVFILKTAHGVLKRPIQRLYPLEIMQKDSEIAEILTKKATSKKGDPKTTVDVCKPQAKISKPKVVTTKSGRIVKKPARLEN